MLLICPQPARISELVVHANADRKDWQPILREDEVQPLFVNHLVPAHILRPLAACEYEIFLSVLNKPLAKWVEQQQELEAPPPDPDDFQGWFDRAQKLRCARYYEDAIEGYSKATRVRATTPPPGTDADWQWRNWISRRKQSLPI